MLERISVNWERFVESRDREAYTAAMVELGKVIAAGQKAIRLEGPVLEMETEIVAVHEGFWNKK